MTDTKPAPHGWLILDKPRGLGSTQAVGAVKRLLRQAGHARTKVGHGGTLDPLAEGVLPIALGEATKLAGRMLDSDKIYEFTIRFGEETDTLDTEGEVTERCDRRPPMAAIADVLHQFTGDLEQVPPAYSAIKIDGKRAYDRARAGEEFEVKTRSVTIYSLGLLSDRNDVVVGSSFAATAGRPDPYDPGAPLELADSVTLVAHVSKGTYIRSLARDVARALGTFGHVTYLRRIKAGPFCEDQAVSLDRLGAEDDQLSISDQILPFGFGLADITSIEVDAEQMEDLRKGRTLQDLPLDDGIYCAVHQTLQIALVEITEGEARVVRGFNLPG